MVQLRWVKHADGSWPRLEIVPLDDVFVFGVYVIWHAGQPARVVRIGQGNVREILAAHRRDPRILAYRNRGELLVTWASVQLGLIDGVERHLVDQWSPLVADEAPPVAPIAVGSPWM